MARTTAPTVSETIARRMRELRERKGWTQTQLAERITELGFPVHQTWVAKCERLDSGRRKITTEQAMLIAAALEVSPTALLLPPETDATVSIAPNMEVPTAYVRGWFKGLAPLCSDAFPPIAPRFFYETVSDIEYAAREWSSVRRLVTLASNLENAAGTNDRDAMRTVLELMRIETERGLAELDVMEAGK